MKTFGWIVLIVCGLGVMWVFDRVLNPALSTRVYISITLAIGIMMAFVEASIRPLRERIERVEKQLTKT